MNVKAGDLAIVIAATHETNVGAFVEVVGHLTAGGWRRGPDGSLWELSGAGPFWWVCSLARPLINMRGPRADGFIEDARLRPISGLPLDEDVDQVEEITA